MTSVDTLDEWALAVYMRELVEQGETAQLAAVEFSKTMQQPRGGVPAAFAAMQSLLAAGAMTSKLLWPTPLDTNIDGTPLSAEDEHARQRTLAGGKMLRSELSIKSIPILENRRVRNAFEHFDERLDGYLLDEGNRFVGDRNIGPKGQIVQIGGKIPPFLRHIDPQAGTVSVLDDEVGYQELFDAIADVSARASQWADQRHNAR
jgi:hypothetical protein